MTNKNSIFMVTNNETELTGVLKGIDEEKVSIVWEDDSENIMTNEEFAALLESNELSVEELDEDTPAQASIMAHKSADAGFEADGNPKTRFDWIRMILGPLADMDMASLERYYEEQQAMVGGEGSRAGLDKNAGINQASVQMKPSAAMESILPKLQQEEQDAIFAESTLTEEAKTKLSTLFETAVASRLTEELVRIQEAYEISLEQNVEKITKSLVESLDTYMTHVAEEWLTENQVAIESTLRSELTMEFIDGLKSLFEEHYIDIPEDKVDVLESVVNENEKLKEELNKKLNEDIETQKLIKSFQKKEIVSAMSEGLTLPQKTKLLQLSESVDFENEAKFKTKLQIVKEGFVKEKNSNSNIITERFEGGSTEDTNNVSPIAKAAAEAMSRLKM
jgi:hypothetical protein